MAWVVKRDGNAVSPALTSEDEGLRWLQRAQAQSADWAIRYEGYTVEETADVATISGTVTYAKTIESLKPFRLGEYNVPRWAITFTDGTMAATEVDNPIGSELHKAEYKGALVHVAANRLWQVFALHVIPVPPADMLAKEPTVAAVRAYPDYYITGPGREVAGKTECPHGYYLTDSCPNCAIEADEETEQSV